MNLRSGVCAAIALTALGSSGCTTLMHEFGWFSWWSESTRSKDNVEHVEVSSDPPGAQISRTDPAGRQSALGTAPLVDAVPVKEDELVEAPKTSALWIGTGIEFVVGFGLMVAGVGSAGNSTDAGGFIALSVTGALLATAASIDAVAAFIHGLRDPRVTPKTTPVELSYAAHLDGVGDAKAIAVVPGQPKVHMLLTGGATSLPVVVGGKNGAWVVAVMNTEDLEARKADAALLANLSDQIRVYVAEQGIRTIDRGAQEAALKQQISSLKTESYKQCYDAACQIELGKAVAASHILRTRIAHFGQKCVLNGELIDLKTEVTVAAGSSQGSCEAEGFLQMGATLAKQLGGARSASR
jgi:hypothetical protein